MVGFYVAARRNEMVGSYVAARRNEVVGSRVAAHHINMTRITGFGVGARVSHQ